MSLNSPLMLSQWSNELTNYFMDKSETYTYKLMRQLFHKIHNSRPLSLLPEDYAFSWATKIYFHPDLQEDYKNTISRWAIKPIPEQFKDEWEEIYINWFKPMEDDRPIVAGLVNAVMNRSDSPEDWKKLLPSGFNGAINRYEELVAYHPELSVKSKLDDKQVAAFKEKHKAIYQIVQERAAKNMLLGDYQ